LSWRSNRKKLTQSSNQSIPPGKLETTAHHEPKAAATGRRPPSRAPPIPVNAFTVLEFCRSHRISKAKYYELKRENLHPDEMVVGRRRLISFESAERWRRAREAAAAPAA
jgi:hypothetical protein